MSLVRINLRRVFVGNITSMLKVIAALTTLSFQRRDQRRAVMSEIRTPGDITDGHDERKKSIDTKRQADSEEGVT